MAPNPRPALRRMVRAAEAAEAFGQKAPPVRLIRRPTEEVLLLWLRQMGEATCGLHPAVRAMRPEAPWLKVDFLRHLDPLRDSLSSLPMLEKLMEREVPALGKAAAEIISELDEKGIIAPQSTVAPPAVYQLKVTLAEITPPIWRRLLAPNHTTLRKLHLCIQIAGGWWNYHLHLFEIAGTEYGYPDPNGELSIHSDAHVKLNALPLRPGSHFRYLYDFGDGWEHEILLEKVLPADEAPRFPLCLEGKRAFPHEDSGGIPGYYRVLRILRLPEHPEHAETRTWVGPRYDPESFDLDFVNRQLRTGRLKPALH
jgi:hypothetical protein